MPADLVSLVNADDWVGLRHALRTNTHPVDVLSAALVKAMFREHLDAVRMLLDAGADPSAAPDEAAMPAVCAAAMNLWPEGVQLLLDRGADVNARALQAGGWTPLMFAVDATADDALQGDHAPSLDLLAFLLERGADRTVRNRRGEIAADIARAYGWREAVALLSPLTP